MKRDHPYLKTLDSVLSQNDRNDEAEIRSLDIFVDASHVSDGTFSEQRVIENPMNEADVWLVEIDTPVQENIFDASKEHNFDAEVHDEEVDSLFKNTYLDDSWTY